MISYPLDIQVNNRQSRVGTKANYSQWFDLDSGERFVLADYHTHMVTSATTSFNVYRWKRSLPWVFSASTSTIHLGNNTAVSTNRRKKKRSL